MALIVDIPMPKNCHECHLYCDFTRRMDIDRNEHERPQDCLIKGEIPDEHGDLVDRDKLREKVEKYAFVPEQTYTEYMMKVEKAITGATVILEASK